LISTGAGDSYVHAAGVARDGDDWLLADALGSVRATVDQTGNTIGTQSFAVYGEPLTGTTGTFGFTGQQHDPTGLQRLRARQYNPNLGRFTTVDPVQPGGPGTTGYNLYTYAGNNPTTWTDPSGQSVPYAATLQPSRLGTPGGVLIGISVTDALVGAGIGLIVGCLVYCPKPLSATGAPQVRDPEPVALPVTPPLPAPSEIPTPIAAAAALATQTSVAAQAIAADLADLTNTNIRPRLVLVDTNAVLGDWQSRLLPGEAGVVTPLILGELAALEMERTMGANRPNLGVRNVFRGDLLP